MQFDLFIFNLIPLNVLILPKELLNYTNNIILLFYLTKK